jgi:hypothetical protein
LSEDFWRRFPPIPGFNCIKMKEDIQAKIYEEIKDMSSEELLADFNRAGDRIRLRHRQAASHDAPLMAREDSADYGKKKQ